MVAEAPDDASLLLEGVERFNARRFWDAHESWERIWLHASPRHKGFLQGLIQLAAACHHLQRRNWTGALRLLDSSKEKLARYGGRHLGVELSPLSIAADTLRASASAAASGNAEIDASEYPSIAFDAAESATLREEER